MKSPPDAHQRPSLVEIRLARIRRLTHIMDGAFNIPIVNHRVGLDGIVGLLPGAGDVVTGAIAFYIVYLASKFDLPRHLVAQMIANVVIDIGIGSVPIAGDLFDFFYKCNEKNLALLEDYLSHPGLDSRPIQGRHHAPDAAEAMERAKEPARQR